MSGLADPRKDFRWALEIDGANQFLLQECQAPSLEVSEVKHGAPVNEPDKKTPGKLVVGDLVIKKLMLGNFPDRWAEDWMAQAMAGLQSSFVKTGFLKHLGVDGFSTVDKWFLGNIWVKKIEKGNLQSLAPGANMIETVTFSVEYYYNTNSPAFAALLGAGIAGGVATALGSNSPL